ncbi:LysR substrate-binding domain-containing protein [Acidocella sp. KAb 2-4]|uniref:LysR substrate-binding domain-containing protein n=1 Tax=Acidocella sp. KAb 2-4 TaxID=2885158 RepID=UPI001D088DE0|nr:LysR substrate-binding domain-containing protein [Acidocella sp. KAb 2-4]MCB5944222.1 LysR family transcriptional regulator [Acidocella sp. KAb 2-4]
MELRHLRYFIAVAEELNFTRAAQRLNTAQPSLSQQILDLEHEIGTPLLTRTKRSVALTVAGQAFLNEARLTIAQARNAVATARRAAELEGHKLTIGFVPAAEIKVFPGILTLLRESFPKLQLQLQSFTSLEQRDALLRGDIDIAFMRPPLSEPGLVAKTVLQEQLVAVLPADHTLASRDEVNLHELAETPFLEISPMHGGRLFDTIREHLRAQGVVLDTVQQVENVLTLFTLIGLGVGFSLMPDYAESLLFRNVTTRRLAGEPIRVDLIMAWREDDKSPEVTAFRELVDARGPVK